MNFRRRTPKNGIRNGNRTPGRGVFSNGSNGQDEKVPGILKKRLQSGNPSTAIMGINGLLVRDPRTREFRYSKKEICKNLVWLMKSSEEKDVKNAAANALLKMLAESGGLKGSSVVDIIDANLTEKNARHLRLWTKIIGEKNAPVSIRECAIGKLAEYSEDELIGKIEGIEMLLLERMMDAGEKEGIQDMIRNCFGPGRSGRPKIGQREEKPEDMTVQIETFGNRKPARAGRGAQGATQDIDAIGLQVYLLRQSNPAKRREGAKNLYEAAMKSKNPNTIRRVLDALEERGKEFSAECRDVAMRLEIVSADSRNRATIPPGPR
ncbi:hypothetical protein GF412_04720 [Candidatus Micrarchaeota archaeon]|nr:hypothetical protein [Candidatus Micrarchaeota archaeon]MBD3418256.1 hypothetical protein [Candidatus Micrarchaeota archaeon]